MRARRLAGSFVVAFVILAAFGSVAGAQASTVTGLSATASTYSAGATAVEYSVGFTAPSGLAAHAGYVELTGPVNSTLSTTNVYYSVSVTGTSPSGPAAAYNVTPGASSNVVDVYMPSAVAAGDGIQINAYEASNPASAEPSATFSASTSSDGSAQVGFAINSPTAVTVSSATSSAATAGSQDAVDTVTFTADQAVVYANNDTFPTQCLDGECNQGDIILTAPTGTVFASDTLGYSITDVTSGKADPYEVNGAAANPSNVVSLAPSFTINAGDKVTVVAYEVENPSSPVPSGTMSVTTTSDTSDAASASVSFPIGPSAAVTNAVVATSSTTAGATDPKYLIGLTTTHALSFWNDGSEGTGWVVLTFPSAVVGEDDTVMVSDAAHPTPVAGTAGQYGYHISPDEVDIGLPFAVPAGTALTITLWLNKNSTPFAYPTVSTSSDTVPVSPGAPTNVKATAGNVSAGVSWTAVAAPFGSTLTDAVITPFVGASAQTPFDSASTATNAVVPALTNGTAYTFEVADVYTDGTQTYDGAPSAASNSVTPSTSSGVAGAATAFSTKSLNFGLGFTGQSTPAQTVTVYDIGTQPLSVSGVSLTGSGAQNFRITADDCAGTSVAAGASCTVSAELAPKGTTGSLSASLEFTDNASGSPQAIALTGTATNDGYVSGRVYDSTKSSQPGLPGSDVAMCPTGGGACYSGGTDSSGDYTVGPIPAGTYTVTVSAGTLNVVDATYDAQYTVVTGRQTNNIGLPEPEAFPPSVTLIGTGLGTAHFLEADDPATILFTPQFPTEPAGTEIAYLINSAVTSLYNQTTASLGVASRAGVTYISGAIVLIVSYGAGGTPTVIGEYPDTSSGASPTVTLSATSPGSSTSDSTSPPGILDQYLPSGQIQSVIPPIPHVLWTQISNEPSYYVVSHSNAPVDVQAVGPHIVIGAVPPPLNGGGATSLACAACGDEYFDPSGTVESTGGIPLESAKVTLLRSKSAKGKFAAVPNGSSIMSSQNRKDPFETNALGAFGWDTVPGYYRVSASHSGCTGAPHGKPAETRVYSVPPPVDGIVIRLKCAHLKRSVTHVKLKITTGKRGTFVATVTVTGRHSPVGNVTFNGAGLHAVLPLNGKRQAQIVLVHAHESITASYSGDALNAPSRGQARSR